MMPSWPEWFVTSLVAIGEDRGDLTCECHLCDLLSD